MQVSLRASDSGSKNISPLLLSAYRGGYAFFNGFAELILSVAKDIHRKNNGLLFQTLR